MSERSPEEIQAAIDRAYRRADRAAFVKLLVVAALLALVVWWFFG